mmetsp:Transcript_40327/g.56770  ORF Transcript_40327/g.56770 Transcript_40327/m.56770 type:complete len:91 (+) Transcript_40327:107-379(+)
MVFYPLGLLFQVSEEERKGKKRGPSDSFCYDTVWDEVSAITWIRTTTNHDGRFLLDGRFEGTQPNQDKPKVRYGASNGCCWMDTPITFLF